MSGGLAQRAADATRSIVFAVTEGAPDLRRQSIGRLTKHGEGRIEHAFKFDLPGYYRLVCWHHGDAFIFLYVGSHADSDRWCDANRGLRPIVDGRSKRLTLPRNLEYDMPLPPTVHLNAGDADRRLLDMLPQDAQELLVTLGVGEDHPIRLLSIGSEDDDILGAIESESSERLRDLLLSVLIALRSGNHPDAAALVRHAMGAAKSLGEMPSAARVLSNPVNSDEVVSLEELGEERLRHHLSAGYFSDWMLYLHPDQAALANEHFDGVARLHGVSGSGKTSVLLHRAVELARRYKNQRIAVVTLNRSLARLLSDLLDALCPPMRRGSIDVLAVYDLSQRITRHFAPTALFRDLDPQSGETPDHSWDDYWDKAQTRGHLAHILVSLEQTYGIDAKRYVREEYAWVRSGFARTHDTGSGLPGRTLYLDAERSPRTGRSVTFRQEWRQTILEAVEEYERYLAYGGLADPDELSLEAHRFVGQLKTDTRHPFRYRCVLVDEYQDLGSIELELLRSIVSDEPDSLFLAGDPDQRVMTRLQSLDAAGIEVRHRKSIRKNYRNPRRVLEAGLRLLGAVPTSALAEAQGDALPPELSERDTARPACFHCRSREELYALLVASIQGIDLSRPSCIVSCRLQDDDDRPLLNLARRLRGQGIEATPITHSMKHRTAVLGGGLFVASLGSIKGFEFSHVYIIDAGIDDIPPPGLPIAESWRSARRLYVAMTRAVESLSFLYIGIPSPLLSAMGDTLAWRTAPNELGHAGVVTRAWVKVPSPAVPGSGDSDALLNVIAGHGVGFGAVFLEETRAIEIMREGIAGWLPADIPLRAAGTSAPASLELPWCAVALAGCAPSSLPTAHVALPTATSGIAAIIDLTVLASAPAWFIDAEDRTPIHRLWRRSDELAGPRGAERILRAAENSPTLGIAFIPGRIPAEAVVAVGFPTVDAFNHFVLRTRLDLRRSEKRRLRVFPEAFRSKLGVATDISLKGKSPSAVPDRWEVSDSGLRGGPDSWWSGKGAKPNG